MMVRLDQIEPLVCVQDTMRAYVAMLEEGKKAPPVVLCRNHNKRWQWRIFDGAHRVRAAKFAGRTTIDARIIRFEGS